MQALTQCVRLVTVLIAMLGLWSLASRIGDGGWLAAWVDLGSDAAARPWVWLAAIGWWACHRLARAHDQRNARGLFRAPDAGRMHVAKAPAEGPKRVDTGRGGGAEPILSARRDEVRRDEKLRRLRLAALLKGRSPDVPAFIDTLLIDAAESGASDIHLQPHDGASRVTLRVRGERQEIAQYPKALHADVVRRVKVLSGMLPYVSDRAQEGRFGAEIPSGSVEIRASAVPSNHGETVALRLAGQADSIKLGSLGFQAGDLARLESLLLEPQGLLVLTGPTGSGKTTTLYSALAHIQQCRAATTHLASIEDPVELDLPFVHQMQVDRARKLGFADALRSLLRQDPDVLMLGEIRDRETAKVAVQAGLSGHLILTTLHADSAAGVFPRLIDLGVEPFLAGSAMLGCVSQRLVRRLCEHCRHPRALDRKQRTRLEELGISLDEPFFTAEGCVQCDRSGFSGRLAIFEILLMDAELRRLVASKTPVDELQRAARSAGASTLFDNGIEAASKGEVSLSEVLPWAGLTL